MTGARWIGRECPECSRRLPGQAARTLADLCLGLPIVRFDGDVLGSGTLGEVNFQVRLDALPQGVQFQVGESWNFQYWFRDSNPQPTSNTSDGLSITPED